MAQHFTLRSNMRLQRHYKWAIAAASVAVAATSAVAIPVTTNHTLTSNATCHVRGDNPNNYLPDPTCTPGATNPNVTQANIQSTICVKGYTATIRPPVSYTAPLKKQIDVQYGFPMTEQGELDHLISLELGGNPTDPKNLWVEPGSIPNPKDTVENRLKSEVCAGTITLAQAQSEIVTNWYTAK